MNKYLAGLALITMAGIGCESKLVEEQAKTIAAYQDSVTTLKADYAELKKQQGHMDSSYSKLFREHQELLIKWVASELGVKLNEKTNKYEPIKK